MAGMINTMEELEYYYYGPGYRYLNRDETSYFFGKTDDDALTTTTGIYNPIFSADVWYQTNHDASTFGALPKYAAKRAGWRVISSDLTTGTEGGISEDGAIPDAHKPTWAEVSAKPATVAHAFAVSEIQTESAKVDDNAGTMESQRKYFASYHRLQMNRMLLAKTDSAAYASGFESVDRVATSYSEIAGCSITSNYGDIYSLDRDAAASWADGYSNHNNGTVRDLTASLLIDQIQGTRALGGNPSVFITGYDTYAAIQGLFESQVRYTIMKETKAQFGVNGIDTGAGVEAGINVSSIYGIPLIVSNSVPKDTISRVYLLDTSDPEGFNQPRLGLRMNRPTQYFEAGIATGNPFAISKFADKGVYRTMGQLICYKFGAQSKLRDLK
jgi:hypothetical protein